MPVVKTITCTRCGAPLELHSARAKTVVCAHCSAQLDLTSPDYGVLAELRAPPMVHPLAVGMRGELRKVAWEIVAHVRWAEETWWWDEYLLLAEDGRTAWLQYDERRFSVWWPFTPREPGPVDQSTNVLVADGERQYVSERGRAMIRTIAGELTWRARIGDTMTYLDAPGLGVEITAREIEWFRRYALTPDEVAAAFGVPVPELRARMYEPPADVEDDEEDSGGGPGALFGVRAGGGVKSWMVTIALFVLLGLGSFCLEECDDGDDYGGGGGHFGGGGFSGGK